MYENSSPPVNEGEEHTVTIEAVGEKGDGIARVKGFVLFVAGTRAGETKRVKITKVLAKVGFAEVVGDAAPGKKDDAPRREKPKEPDFDPQPELDSEDF